jgi:hypothetical protein
LIVNAGHSGEEICVRTERRLARVATVALAAVAITACNWFGDESPGEVPPDEARPTAVLRVSAVGLPDSVLRDSVALRVTSADHVIEISTQDIQDMPMYELTPGIYTVAVSPVRTDHEIVDTVLDPVSPPSQVELTAGEETELVLSFATRPGSGALWISSAASKRLVRYAASELSGTGTPDASLDFDLSEPSELLNQDLVVLPDGAIWLARYTGAGALHGFHPTQWVGLDRDDPLPSPGATVVDPDGVLSGSTSLDVDTDGSLFVVQYTGGGIVRLDGVTAGDLTPDAVFETPSDTSVFHSARLGPTGDLWVGSWIGSFDASTRALLRFRRTDLAQDGSHTVSPDLSGNLDVPFVVEFDPDGRLWVAVYGPDDYQGAPDGRLLRFDNPDSLTDGFTAADADLSLEVYAAPGDRVLPVGIAFDNSGFLWTADYDFSDGGTGRMVRINGASVPPGATSVTATAVFTGTPPSSAGDWGTYLAFNPPSLR